MRQSPMLPEDVGAVVERYLRLADEACPARIQGVYLVGSVALDDFRPGQSDIDFVAVTEQPLTVADLVALEKAHRQLGAEFPRPWFDGIYVTWQDLGRDPTKLTVVPFTHEGRFHRAGGREANPSVWLTLRNHPLAVRGPSAVTVWHDPARTRAWNLDNLNSYWRAWVARGRGISRRTVLVASRRLLDGAIAWGVPGVARLHYTIATGDVTSKSGACRYALTTFPERWHPIVREALALRNGEPTEMRDRRRRYHDALAFMEFVIADATTPAVSRL